MEPGRGRSAQLSPEEPRLLGADLADGKGSPGGAPCPLPLPFPLLAKYREFGIGTGAVAPFLAKHPQPKQPLLKFDRLLHSQAGLPICKICGKGFAAWYNLQQHVENRVCRWHADPSTDASPSTLPDLSTSQQGVRFAPVVHQLPIARPPGIARGALVLANRDLIPTKSVIRLLQHVAVGVLGEATVIAPLGRYTPSAGVQAKTK